MKFETITTSLLVICSPCFAQLELRTVIENLEILMKRYNEVSTPAFDISGINGTHPDGSTRQNSTELWSVCHVLSALPLSSEGYN